MMHQITLPSIARSFLIRKLLTKLFWKWETQRKYQIRQRAFNLPPIPVNANSSTVLAVLTTPSTICDAAWAAQSLLNYLPAEIGLTIVVDGELPATVIENLKVLFPGIILNFTRTLLEEIRSIAPKTAQLGDYHPMGRKLATILSLQQKYNLLYSDADILCFGEMPEISQALKTNSEIGLYLQDIGKVQIEPITLERVHSLGLEYASTINVGFLYIPQNSLEIGIAEKLLDDQKEISSWFPDTMILSVLMQQAKAKPLPRSRYVVSAQRQFYFEEDVCYDKIAVRHFITPVRHLMYSKGMPKLLPQLQRQNS